MSTRQGTPRPPTSLIHTRPRYHTISSSLPTTPLASTFPVAHPPLSLKPTPLITVSKPPLAKPIIVKSIPTKSPLPKDFGPTFICTICWQPQHPPSKPKILGSSSRIVCHACWRAVLDLSICWVCGECIVRGDEVVSLGWCFWHRGCFGCLLCGVGLGDVEGFMGDGNKGVSEKKGMELDKIPLCEWCEVETKVKGYGEKKVLERGLENVTRFDGGLTRCRLEKLDEDRGVEVSDDFEERKEKGKDLLPPVGGLDGEEMFNISSAPRATQQKSTRLLALNERKIRKLIQESSTPQEEFPLLEDAAGMGVSEDGNNFDDDDHSHSDLEVADFGQHEAPASSSNIYVSIFDPIGQPFVPSKTKPLPKWMSLLPNNVHREREHQRKAGIAESCGTFPDAYAGLQINHTEECSKNHGKDLPCSSSEEITPKGTRHPSSTEPTIRVHTDRLASFSDTTGESTRLPSIADGSPEKPITKTNRSTRPRSVSIEAKAMKDHPHGSSSYRRTRRSNTFGSTSLQPLEHRSTGLYERRPTPYPKLDDPFSNDITIGSDSINIPRKASCCELGSTLEFSPPQHPSSTFESFPNPSKIDKSKTPSIIASSSEYLDRYNPITSILPGNFKSYTPSKEPEPIIEKIKRQRVGTLSLGEIARGAVERRRERSGSGNLAEEGNGKGKGKEKEKDGDEGKEKGKGKEKVGHGNEEYGLDPRREDLKRELRNLFCEE